MDKPVRPRYLTDILFGAVDQLIGNSDDVEINVAQLRKAIRKEMRKLPWKQRSDPAYRAIKRSVRLFRPDSDIEPEFTGQEVVDHYTIKGWNVEFIPKDPNGSSLQGSYYHLWK